jgi:hypothetical protein
MSKEPEHVVTRVNDGWYVCDECGQTGSERWAILHQFPQLDNEDSIDSEAVEWEQLDRIDGYPMED